MKTHSKRVENIIRASEYYIDYFALFSHFVQHHFTCLHLDCIAKRYIFSTRFGCSLISFPLVSSVVSHLLHSFRVCFKSSPLVSSVVPDLSYFQMLKIYLFTLNLSIHPLPTDKRCFVWAPPPRRPPPLPPPSPPAAVGSCTSGAPPSSGCRTY